MSRILNRRKFIKKTGIITAGSVLLSKAGFAEKIFNLTNNTSILNIEPLSLPWKTQDPFIKCYGVKIFPI
jgi:hypothetical protein